MALHPAPDELERRLDAWLSDVAVDRAGSNPLPEGVGTDHVAEVLRERERQHAHQVEALTALTAAVGRRTGDPRPTLQTISEVCAKTLGVARASIWRTIGSERAIHCEDLYVAATDQHSFGLRLDESDCPGYFAVLGCVDILDADDAQHDQRTRELTDRYLRPLGIGAILDAGIHVDGSVAGVLCCEHVGSPRRWTSGEKAFVVAAANLVSLLFESAERESARAELRLSEERFRSIASALTDTIWDWDPVSNRLWWNDGIESEFGHAAESLEPGIESWSSRIHPDDRERVLKSIREAIDGSTTRWSSGYRFMHADGRALTVQDTGLIVRDAEGRAVRMVGGIVDISARAEAEAELVRARQLAEEASRVKTEFLANMSHEMRTPLTAVLGFSDLLMDPSMAAGDRLDYVQSIRRNGAHLLALIDDVLDLSSMEAKVANLQRTSFSLHHVLNEVVSMMQVRASYKGIGFSLVYDTPIPARVEGDPDRVRQILFKLIGNAIKFTDVGDVRVCARLRLGGKSASAIEVEVRDTGIGIAAEDLSNVFQPFWQANASTVRRHGGSGLGLPICQPLARAMGGDILVRSEHGKGSSFILRLPHTMESSSRMVRHPSEDISDPRIVDEKTTPEIDSNDRDASSDSKQTGRILLAEDGPDNQLLISTMLRKRGYEVTVVDNGVDAVERALLAAASGRPYHVILMDMQMPRLDGYGATALLRSRGYGRPILALTAHALPEERKRCEVAGCDEFLSKPVAWPLLMSTIERHLQKEVAGDAMGTDLTHAGTNTNRADSAESIYSTLGGDPEMAELVDGFVERLPGQLREIREAFAQEDRDRLRRLAHQLKGAGGSYGFDAVSEGAALLECAAKDDGPADAVEMQVAAFEALCGRVRSGTEGADGDA